MTDYLMLDKNECSYPMPEEIKTKVERCLLDIKPNRYPDPSYKDLKRGLAKFTGFSANKILLGNGGDEILWMFFAAYSSPGKTIMTLSPSFSEYKHLANVYKAKHVTVPLKVSGDEVVVEEDKFIETMREEKPTAIILDTPNNPSGALLPLKFIDRVIEEAQCPVMVDEAYGEFASMRHLERWDDNTLPENVVVLKTFSKAWGLAGLRVGYAIASTEIAQKIESIRSPFNVNVFSSAVALELLKNHEWLEDRVKCITSTRDNFISFVQSEMPTWTVIPSESNFVLLKSPMSLEEILKKLEERGVVLRFPDVEWPGTWVRVTIGTAEETEKLKNILKNL